MIEKFYTDGLGALTERADRDIDKYRKGDFTLTLQDGNGKPLQGVTVELTHQTHDFDFGCNFFMYRQYDTPEENARYEQAWLTLFNTAVVPLYWEGTEPTKGYLRYDRQAPNDVYRRPPAGAVTAFCREHGVRTKGHPLFWHEFIPDWLPRDFEEVWPLLEKRFAELAATCGDIPVLDCVNEPGRIWDIIQERPGQRLLSPPPGYVERVFALARRYFPRQELILNEAVGGSFIDFKGYYGGYYQLLKRLLEAGVSIDRIGLQCHTWDGWEFRNVYDAGRLYQVLDVYATLGKPLVLSEISIPSLDPAFQAKAVEMLYKVCFSHPAMSGIFWWNLPDDGILTTKRKALGENMPTTGLIDMDWQKKPAYHTLDRLINQEWRTNVTLTTDQNGQVSFRGFTGTYAVQTGDRRTTVHLPADGTYAKEL